MVVIAKLTGLDELPLPYKFDVSDYYRIDNQELREHIDRVGRIIYSRQDGKN